MEEDAAGGRRGRENSQRAELLAPSCCGPEPRVVPGHRREFCHFAGTLSTSLSKRLLNAEGAAEWQSRRRLVVPVSLSTSFLSALVQLAVSLSEYFPFHSWLQQHRNKWPFRC